MESETSGIVRGLRRRDPELLCRLIDEYQHRLLRYLIVLMGERSLAEDLFQETWVRVLERGYQYNGRCEFAAWLFSIARNLSIDCLRKKRPASLEHLQESSPDGWHELADPQPAAWELLDQRQHAGRIRDALAKVPLEFRDVIVLRFQEGMSLEEISIVTGAPLGTVKSRLSRGLDRLAPQLADLTP